MQAEATAGWVHDARERTFELVADLTDEQLMGPRLAIVNPLLWEIGHVAWFQEKWVLRHVCGEDPVRADSDTLWDSIAIPHDVRWDLPLLSREETLAYMREVRDRVLDRLRRRPSEELIFFAQYTVFHEDMHTEAFTYTRQTLGYPAPAISSERAARAAGRGAASRGDGPGSTSQGGHGPASGAAQLAGAARGPCPGDAEVPGGVFLLGAPRDAPFAFDNEKWAHPVELEPFAIARAPVTQAEFAEFVEDGGYRRREWWSDEGWAWRESAGKPHPVYWRRQADGWVRRDFDRWVPLEPHRPVIHVNFYEAEAFCRWAGRRLPTEAEWEAAAAGTPAGNRLGERKCTFPWGEEPPTPERANLDGSAMGCVDVGACPNGDGAFGVRQMIGNVWEWTSTTFLPYPGFEIDAYREYSEPWFGTRKVLRGGCWATRSRLIRNTYRNFYTPDRRDVWAGFRTCALEL